MFYMVSWGGRTSLTLRSHVPAGGVRFMTLFAPPAAARRQVTMASYSLYCTTAVVPVLVYRQTYRQLYTAYRVPCMLYIYMSFMCTVHIIVTC